MESTARKSIAIIQGAFFPVPPLRGGAVEKLWYALGREFAMQGHAVTHVSRTFDGLSGGETIDSVRYARVRGYDQPANPLWLKWCDLRYSLRAVRRLPATNITITNSFWSPLLLRRRQGVYVCVERMPKGQMRLYRSAARLHACSSAVRDAILREDPKAASRIVVIPNPLPVHPERPVDWARKSQVILFVGRIHPEKGIELLLKAFQRAKRGGTLCGWKLRLVGPVDEAGGGGGTRWFESLQEFRHSDVEFRPAVYHSGELAALYEEATLFTYPSLAEKGETFGVSVLEAMAWGAVPVVSDLACFRDFVTQGENGYVFNHRSSEGEHALAEALSAAAINPSRELANAALRVRSSHDAAAIARCFLTDFAQLNR